MTIAPLDTLVRNGFQLPLTSIHGPAHWARVRENGLRLATETGADRTVVELFALLHDSQRRSDGRDPGHGRRAAEWALTLRGSIITLPPPLFDLLYYACEYHTAGLTEADPTVQTCWDADRLDLGRVGIRPLPERLCTPAARAPEIILWGWQRSRGEDQRHR